MSAAIIGIREPDKNAQMGLEVGRFDLKGRE